MIPGGRKPSSNDLEGGNDPSYRAMLGKGSQGIT